MKKREKKEKVKCYITKILNSEENSKQKVRNEMAISNAPTHETIG